MVVGVVERIVHGGERHAHARRADQDALQLVLVLEHGVELAVGLDALLRAQLHVLELQRGGREHGLAHRLEREGEHAGRVDGDEADSDSPPSSRP